MIAPFRVAIILALLLLRSLAATPAVDGEVHTLGFFACTEQALRAIKAGQASPTTNDHARAERARADAMTRSTPAVLAIESPDPQIHGMEAEGAKNAAFIDERDRIGNRLCV
jgi:hypothetical protein